MILLTLLPEKSVHSIGKLQLPNNPIEIEEQRRLLLSIKPRNEIVERMIERSLQALEEGLAPMTPEEVMEYLGRKSIDGD